MSSDGLTNFLANLCNLGYTTGIGPAVKQELADLKSKRESRLSVTCRGCGHENRTGSAQCGCKFIKLTAAFPHLRGRKNPHRGMKLHFAGTRRQGMTAN